MEPLHGAVPLSWKVKFVSRGQHPNGNATPPSAVSSEYGLGRSDDARSRHYLIGKSLREWYNAVVREPVPDDLLRLLDQLA